MPEHDYLTALLDAYWFAPPVALWRAVELRAAAQETFARPLLDVGCGDALIGRVLFGSGGIDAGIDPWAAQLRAAARSGVYRWVQQADGLHLPYASATFATAFINSVLEHIPDVAPVVREVGRVLRPGGRFIFTVPSDAFRRLLDAYQVRLAAGDPEGAERYAAQVDRRLAHYHYHTPGEWGELLDAAGMEVESARYYVPEPTARLWDRMNGRFGIGRRSLWGMLASPRLRPLGTQAILQRWVVQTLGRAWRPYYEMDVEPGHKGSGLLVVGRKLR
ncbi:MAG: class I SAM-dependent methyltransferase [Anaerolineae bacterium]|nr:class I SAM-dependent methyltransferase [Anaerolineae bacterium]